MKVDLTQEQIDFISCLCFNVGNEDVGSSDYLQKREMMASEIEDILSNAKEEEPLDDETLDKMAYNECVKMLDSGVCHVDDVAEFYKAGYRQKERG